ncbi:glycosyltransferase family 4 protein [Aureimonas frigidaquae]|uniref:Group 1 glycosyl transferase n=1 Tax=Aureimonas frigidaquae TaxID=424757 RepID=A0A0P0Z469_9HYPH|nr:glycosyltransferase family 4 protein [Aureimonas frigidaquae]BAT28819.1 group 1 glycosyl transferase [Aureimonas frigidaquae]
MRCCLLAWDYPPSPSGLSTAAREIAESLVAEGCDMTVITLDRTGETVEGGVRILGAAFETGALARLRKWGGAGHLAAPLAFRRAVLAAHRARPFAVVEATNWYAPAALLTGRSDLPLVTRNSTPAAYSRVAAKRLRDRIDNASADRLERRQVLGSAGLISNTQDHGARMAQHYGIDPDVPHATIGLSLPPEFLQAAAQAPYPGTGDVRLLFVGRAEERKGFPELIEAIGILAEEAERGSLPNFRLRLLGVPPEDLPEGLAPGAARRIEALGRRPQEDLMREYAAAHIVVAPSRYESFGLVYQEALAYGRAVVASASDASARAFVGAGGVLASQTSAPALVEVLRPLIAEPEHRLGMRNRALAAASRFTRASLGRETLDLYRAAIARSQSR